MIKILIRIREEFKNLTEHKFIMSWRGIVEEYFPEECRATGCSMPYIFPLPLIVNDKKLLNCCVAGTKKSCVAIGCPYIERKKSVTQ